MMDDIPTLVEILGILAISIWFVSGVWEPLFKYIALISSYMVFALLLVVWVLFDQSHSGYQFSCELIKLPEYNLSLTFGLDGISLAFSLLTAFIIPLCILSCMSMTKQLREFLVAILLLELFLLISFMTTNLFFFYVFFESVLIPMFFLIGLGGSRERKIYAAYVFFLYTLIGSFFLLVGMAYLFIVAESLDYNVLSTLVLTPQEQIGLWFCFFIPFAVKIPMFPFHIWLPEAHVEAPTVGSVILASLLLKLGGYGFLRFTAPLFPCGTMQFEWLVFLLTVISVIYASLTAIRQSDLKKIVAYSSIAHMNIIVLGLFSNSFQGIDGAFYLMIGHGLVSSAMFFCIGILYDRYETRALRHYSGLVQTMPIFSSLFFIFTLANMSFPGTSNFVGEFLIFVGLVNQNVFVSIVSATSIVFGAVYSIWLFNRIVFGTSKYTSLVEINRHELIILGCLLIMIGIVGLSSNLITNNTSLSLSQTLWQLEFRK